MELRCNMEETTGDLLRLIRNSGLVNNPDVMVRDLLSMRALFAAELTEKLIASGHVSENLDPRRMKAWDYGLPTMASADQKGQIALRAIYVQICTNNGVPFKDTVLLHHTISILQSMGKMFHRQGMAFNVKLAELLWKAWLGYDVATEDTSDMSDAYRSALAIYIDPRRLRANSKVRKLL